MNITFSYRVLPLLLYLFFLPTGRVWVGSRLPSAAAAVSLSGAATNDTAVPSSRPRPRPKWRGVPLLLLLLLFVVVVQLIIGPNIRVPEAAAFPPSGVPVVVVVGVIVIPNRGLFCNTWFYHKGQDGRVLPLLLYLLFFFPTSRDWLVARCRRLLRTCCPARPPPPMQQYHHGPNHDDQNSEGPCCCCPAHRPHQGTGGCRLFTAVWCSSGVGWHHHFKPRIVLQHLVLPQGQDGRIDG
jgi:hypothetical protein